MKHKYSKEVLEELVKRNISVAGVMRELGLVPRGRNYSIMRNKIIDVHKIDVSHFKSCVVGSTWNRLDVEDFKKFVLIENSNWPSTKVKKRLIEFKLLKEECVECSVGPVWNGKELTLQLDHIDGDSTNNRIENLRIMCPNCHSQTETFNIGMKKRSTA